MSKDLPCLYPRVYAVAAVLAILALALFGFGLYRVRSFVDMNGYAFAFIAVMLAITALVIVWVYGRQEIRFRRSMAEPLLAYTATPQEHEKAVAATLIQIRQANTLTWLTILIICGLLALIGPIFFADFIISLIALGIAAAATLLAFLITRWRSHKLRNGSRQVLLSRNGVYAAGEFHSWGTFSAKLLELLWQEPQTAGKVPGIIQGRYRVLGAYRSNEGFFTLTVPAAQSDAARKAVEQIRKIHLKP